MAMYLYNGLCYAAPSSVYAAMAADCPPVTSDGSILTCTPTATGYTVKIGNSAEIIAVPTLEECIPEVQDAVVLGSLVVAALVSVFVVRLLWRAF